MGSDNVLPWLVDLGSAAPTDTERQLIGLLAVDTLQYGEEWRIAARLQACLVAN